MKFGDGTGPSAAVIATLIAAVPGAAETITLQFADKSVSGVADINIGSPGVAYSLIVDPASSNTWIGVNASKENPTSGVKTGDAVAVAYGSGEFKGEEYDDVLALGGSLVNQSIGIASTTKGFTDVDGIIGIGPTDLTLGTLIPGGDQTVPTVLDNLVTQGLVDGSVITIANYSVTFGTSDPIGDVIYSPITALSPASLYWGLDATFTYGGSSVVPQTAGIIDHGSTLTLLATSSYQKLLAQTSATQDDATSLPVLNSCDELSPIVVTLAGGDISIDVDHYRWPAELNIDIGGNATNCYLAVGDIGSDFNNLHSGSGPQFRSSAALVPGADVDHLKFILGYNTLKHYTVVLDKDGSRIGISSEPII